MKELPVAARGEYKGSRTGGQRNDRRRTGGGPRPEGQGQGRSDNRNGEPRVGGERSDRRPRGGRNGRNDRRPGGGRNTNYRDNFDGNNFGNEAGNNVPAPNYYNEEKNILGEDKS